MDDIVRSSPRPQIQALNADLTLIQNSINTNI